MAIAAPFPISGSAFAPASARGPAVQDITALKAVPVGEREDKQLRFVEDQTNDYHFDQQSAAAESLPDIIAPDAGSGRWLRITPSGGVPAAHAASHAAATGSDALSTSAAGAIAIGDAAAVGAGETYSRADHKHSLAAPAAPANVTKAAAAAGAAVEPARADHKHDVDTAAAATIGTANSEGVATSLTRSDHGHDHGAQTTGTHHAAAVAAGANGFMTGADKTKLDGVASGADVTGSNPPQAHLLGGAEHTADILANLNTKISDAILVAASFLTTPAGIWIPAGVQGPWHTSLGSPDNSVSGGWAQTRFHDGADEEISTVFRLPDDIDLAVNPTMTLYFAPDELQGGARVVRLTNGSEYAGVGEVFPAASEGADSSATTPTLQRELFSEVDTLTASLMTLSDLVEYHIGRASTHGDDTLVGHLSFFGALFLYSKKVI